MGGKRGSVEKMRSKRARVANPQRRPRQGPQRETPLTVFVHIPKTAGTTFTAILRDNFPGGVKNIGNAFHGGGGFQIGPVRRLRDAPALRTRDIHVLTGHLPFAVRDVLPADTRYVTFLRDPVERTLSQYYGLLKPTRRKPLPGDGSLAAVLEAGDLVYDNLQTRMLSGEDEPVGQFDESMLERAKENLAALTAFGLAERFDESLVLFQRALGLRSVVYVHQRVATRPRGPEVPEEDVRLAREINRYDDELYTYGRELFERRVAEHGLDFAVDVAAVHAARTGEAPEPPPSAGAADPAALWDLLVRTRAELLVDRRDRVRAQLAAQDEVHGLLLSLQQQVAELSTQLTVPAAEPAEPGHERFAEAPEQARQPKRRGSRRGKRDRLAARVAEVSALRDEAATDLQQVEERIRTVEGEAGGAGSLTMERLRRESTRLRQRIDQLSLRATRLQESLRQVSAPEGERDAAADDEP